MSYDILAPVYDRLNRDVDYGAWADYMERCFDLYMEKRPELVLDLACGTGAMTFELARRGYDMTAIDISEDMLAEAQRRGIAIGEVERAMPLLLHAYIGARRVREIYHVDDAMVEQAIWRHTVGGTGMTDLDKIIWFADMVEPGRDYPGVEELRRLAKTASLDDMVLEGLSQSIRFVVAKGHLIHPDTVLARNELLLKKNGRNEP